MPSPLSRHALRAAAPLLALLAVAGPASAQAPMGTPTPGHPVDRFADRVPIGTQGYVVGQAPTQAANTPDAQATNNESGPLLNGSLSRSSDGGRVVSSPDVNQRTRLAGYDVRIRPDLTATPLATLDGTEGGGADVRDVAVSALGCRDQLPGRIDVCLVSQITNVYENPDGTGFVSGAPIDPLPGSPALKAGTNVSVVGVDGLGGTDGRGLALGYVDPSGDAWVQYLQVTGGRAYPTKNSETATITRFGAPVKVHDADDTDVSGGALGAATNIDLAAGDLDGDGDQEVAAAVDGSQPGGGQIRGFVRAAVVDVVAGAPKLMSQVAEDFGGAAPRPYLRAASTRRNHATILASRVPATFGANAKPARDVLAVLSDLGEVGASPSQDPDAFLEGLTYTGGATPALTARRADQVFLSNQGGKDLQAVVARDVNHDATQELYVASSFKDPMFANLTVVQVKQGVTGAITYAASAFTSVGIGGDGLAIAAADTRNMPGANGCPVTPCQAFLPPASSSGAGQGDDLLYATGANDGVDPPQLRLHYARLNPASSDTQNLGFQASQRVVTSGQPNDVGGDQPRSAGGPPLLATGTFGQRFEIGTPQLRQRDRIEPLVLLNSPPAHLDVIKDKLYDINTCHFVDFQAGECEFFTQYSDKQTATNTVSTSTKEDYAFSTTVTASAGVDTARFKASLTASVTASIGGTTIKGTRRPTRRRVDVNVKAQDDDQLHIVNKHYDILEYPVYAAGAAAPLTYFAAVTPAVVSHRWVSANGPFAKDFVPQHETGNILSYPREPTPTYVKGIDDRPNYGTFGNTEFEVTRTSDNTYGVTTDTLTQDNVDTTFKAGFDASVKAEASGQIGPVAVSGSLEVAGSYAKEDFNTTTNSVGSNLSILSRLGRITAGVGRAGFLVRPFAYFTGPPSENAESGALVIDYAVTPDQGDDTDTFWQAQYGKRPDLGPNLVNYLDPERGIVAATEAARRQSKDISFTPGTCAKEATPTDQRFPQAGDPVCLRMQVENYSLKDRLGSVPVTFYLGDPAYGGKEIGSTSVPNVYARGTLNQKATAVASVDWTVPASLNGRVARVFAVADPAGPGATGVVPEVHEDDNKGWMPLTVYAKSDPIASGVFVSAVDAETDEDTGKLRVSFDVPTQQRVGVDYDVYAYPFDETGAATGTGTRLGTIGAGKPGDTLDGTFGANPLGAGTAYVVAVVPQDRGSELPVSFPSEPVGLTQGTPAAPQGVTATAGDGSAQVQWSAPRSDGGSPVTGYVVRVLDASGTQLQTTSVDAGTLRFTATGLTNGVPVRFEVTAINDRGSGAAAQSDLVTPTGAATQPVRVTAEAQAGGSAVVRWDPPENNGGNAVTSYTVLTSPGTGSVSAPASARQATVTGLTPGSTYRFRVVAQTNRGASAASAESDPIVAYAVPGAPQAVGLEPGVGKVLVRWSPAADNGRPVTTYRVTLSPSGIERTYGPDTRTAEITGLQGGTTYRASVVAENVAGAGPAGTATGATPGTAAQPASPPTAVGAEPGDAAATVSWTAPEKDGGAPITGYRVRSVPGDVRTTVGADARTATVGGLRNGTAYAFVVEAETAAGTGEDSQPSNGVIPRTRPGVPGDLAATAGDASAVVRWSPPASNGGMPITSYVVVTEPGGARTTVGGDQTQATILGLANGTAYTFRVQARSDGGLSDPSDPTPAVTPQASLPAAGAPGGAGGAGGTGIGASGGAGGSGTGGGGGSGGTGGAGGSGIGANGGTGGTAIGAAGGTGGTGGAGGNAAPTVVTAPDGTVYAVPGAVITFPVSISGEMLCRVDGMAAVACTSPYPLAGLAPGVHTIVISAVDGSVAPRTVKLVIDGRPPTASIDRLASYTSLSSIRPQLRVRDLDSGVSRVEVRTRRAKRTGRFGAYVVRTVTAGATRTEVAMAPGTTSCTSVRAIDVLGNASAWSPERCIARAMTPVELQKGQSGAKAYTTTGSRRSVSLAVGRTSRVVVVTGSRTSPVTVSLGRYRKTLSGRALAHGSAVFELPGSLQGTLRVSSASAPIAKVAVQRRP